MPRRSWIALVLNAVESAGRAGKESRFLPFSKCERRDTHRLPLFKEVGLPRRQPGNVDDSARGQSGDRVDDHMPVGEGQFTSSGTPGRTIRFPVWPVGREDAVHVEEPDRRHVLALAVVGAACGLAIAICTTCGRTV